MQPSLTDTPAAANLTETLANLNIFWILGIIVALSVLRFAFVSSKSDTARSISEILESGMIAVALVFLIIRPFVLQAFFIPSASMEPTLLGDKGSGDRILVNKFGYRFNSPQRDDVVVFLAPPAATVPDGLPLDSDFIKRLIGMPGDHLEVVGGVVYVDGQPHNHADVRQALARAGEFGSEAQATGYVSQADHHVKFISNGVMADTHLISLSRLAAVLTNMPNSKVLVKPGYVIRDGQKLEEPFIGEDPDYDMKMWQGEPLKRAHGILDDPTYQNVYQLAFQPISSTQFQADWSQPTGTVPAGNYMMMGDNRNDSSDSTNWGPLEAHRVVGRAQFIFWPPSRIGVIH